MSTGLIVITILIFFKVGWGNYGQHGADSLRGGGFNPLANPGSQWAYFVYNAIAIFACVITWQTMIQHALAAKDSTVARKIYTRTSFFFACRFHAAGPLGNSGTCDASAGLEGDIYWRLCHPGSILAKQLTENPDRITMYAMPTFLATFAPIGVMGLLVAAMLAADMSTDAVYMLSWAGVIYNDILGPFRKNWSEKRGILINRFIVAVIGVFLLVYGLWYPLKGNLWNYIIVTGTIYMSSMSVLLIACCYWKGANSWGAGAAIVLGAALPVAYLVLEQVKATEHFTREVIGVNIWGICTFVLTAAAMIIGSMIKPGKTINVVAAAAAEAAAKEKAAKAGA